ncbi:MAG: FAD-binding oxidoreductase, partial [Asgard group archaeon]|nr:FAD-binding oxidoreductase [Asgard group archaeon]
KDRVSNKSIDLFSYSKDYSPISTRWSLNQKIPAKADFITWPKNVTEVSTLLKIANQFQIPVIPFGSGSGVVGAVLPINGGIMIDMKKMDSIKNINEKNLTATIETGINGMNLERELDHKGYTMGHIPQSIYTSTVGGYIAHKAAGQFSTKYGKIEDMILSFEAVLPTGEIIRSKASPRNSVGPQFDKLLIGSEGTLAIFTEVTVRIWPKPESRVKISYAFHSMENALEAVRSILQAQAYPAVVRIYDKEETARHFPEMKKAKKKCMTIFVCEGKEEVVKTEESITTHYSELEKGINCGEKPVNHWFKTRFNVTESSKYPPMGFIVDTIEVSVMWDNALKLYKNVIKAMKKVPGTVIATGHASHFYPQGVCFYFSFGGKAIDESDHEYSIKVWDACIKATIDSGGSIAHHHGIGINRSHWMNEEWKKQMAYLRKIKDCLDPNNILNPGKMYFGKVYTDDEE